MLDVLIIGAGPTGLLMAAEAARYGLKCRIIDPLPGLPNQSRALAIQPRTLEIFDHLGIVEPFLDQGIRIRAANQMSGSKPLFHLSFQQLDTPYPFILSLEQGKTESILTEYLTSFGVEVERGVECIDIKEREGRVLARCNNRRSGQEVEIEAKWAVGCDGAHSLVRKKLEFPFIGKAFPFTFSLADVKIEWRYPHDELFVFLNPAGILAVIPMPGEGRYRLVFELDNKIHGQIARPDPTLEEVQEIVTKYGDRHAVITDPLWLANFHIHSRLVQSYQKGNIFLAGDAAHIHSPAGGQGMNSGLQDVFNLAWKLASGKQTVIDTYTLERRLWGAHLLKATHWFTRLAAWSNPIGVFCRNRLIEMMAPIGQRRIAQAIGQLSIHYPKSGIAIEAGSFSAGPKAGSRAPNVPVKGTDLYSLMRKSRAHHLLIFGKASQDLREFSSEKMVLIAMNHPEAFMKYGVKKRAIYIIRPDQYVGYRSSSVDVPAIRNYTQVNSKIGR